MDERFLVIMPGSTEPLVLARPSRGALGTAPGPRKGDQLGRCAPGTQSRAPSRAPHEETPAPSPGQSESRSGASSHDHSQSLSHAHNHIGGRRHSHSYSLSPSHSHNPSHGHRHSHTHTGNPWRASSEAGGPLGPAAAYPGQARRLPQGGEQAERRGAHHSENEPQQSAGLAGPRERYGERQGSVQAQSQGEGQEQGEGQVDVQTVGGREGEGQRRRRGSRGWPVVDLRRSLSSACSRISHAMVGKGVPTRDGWQSALQAAAMSYAFIC